MATVFWDSEGMFLIDYKDKGVSITGEYYASILERLKEAIKEKRRGKLTKGVLLLHDNAPVHKSRVALAALHKVGFDILNHTPYSPDLAPSDYYRFPKKKELRVKKITTDDELKEAVSAYFEDKEKTFFYEGINKLIERSEKFIRLGGEYIEKEKQFGFFISTLYPPFREHKNAPSYVCLIEDIYGDCLVVKGLKSKKGKNIFRIVENDISIIDLKDIITYLPTPVQENDNYIFKGPIDVNFDSNPRTCFWYTKGSMFSITELHVLIFFKLFDYL